MRLSKSTKLFTILYLIIGLTGCSKGPSIPRTIPPELETLAQQFRSAPTNNRIELGNRIRDLLPTCEVRDASGNVSSYNYSTPTYWLTREDVIRLLGQPNEVIEGDFIYYLGCDHKYAWSLSVEFFEDHVAVSRIDHGFKTAR
jgi:hypothetical protein